MINNLKYWILKANSNDFQHLYFLLIIFFTDLTLYFSKFVHIYLLERLITSFKGNCIF